MQENDRRPGEISQGQKLFRRGFQTITYPLLFREKTVHADPDGLARAERLHQENYGILVLLSHPSRREPQQAIRTMTKSPEFRDLRFTGPIAAHQTIHGLATLIGKASGSYMHEVVTQKTIDKGKANGHPLGFGSIAYMKDATKALAEEHAVVAMAPQLTRASTVQYEGQDSVDKLLKVAERKTDKIAIHLIAFGFKGFWGIHDLDDYSKRPGLNIGRQYKTIHGSTYTLDEARKLSKGYEKIDEWIFKELAKISPPAQRPQPTNPGL